MTYKEFVEQVAKDLMAVMPKEYKVAEISTIQVNKLGENASYYGIAIHTEGSDIAVSVDLRNGFAAMDTGRPYIKIIEDTKAAAEAAIANRPDYSMYALDDYDAMKANLMIQAIPVAGNEERLATMPHTKWEDIAIVYRFSLGIGPNGNATTLITNEMLKMYGITMEQLHADAVAYAPKRFPASIRTMREVFAEMTGIDVEDLPDEPNSMYVAACNGGSHGAGCIFYPDFMEQAVKKVGGSFYILPSSIHEVLLVPDDDQIPADSLQEMVYEVNRENVAPADWLSDNIYHYDAQTRTLELVR